jgi:hypothetical protein
VRRHRPQQRPPRVERPGHETQHLAARPEHVQSRRPATVEEAFGLTEQTQSIVRA